jgi:hypothetical protein
VHAHFFSRCFCQKLDVRSRFLDSAAYGLALLAANLRPVSPARHGLRVILVGHHRACLYGMFIAEPSAVRPTREMESRSPQE